MVRSICNCKASAGRTHYARYARASNTNKSNPSGPVAQSDRASAFEAEGCRFESCRDRQFKQIIEPLLLLALNRSAPAPIPVAESSLGPVADWQRGALHIYADDLRTTWARGVSRVCSKCAWAEAGRS